MHTCTHAWERNTTCWLPCWWKPFDVLCLLSLHELLGYPPAPISLVLMTKREFEEKKRAQRMFLSFVLCCCEFVLPLPLPSATARTRLNWAKGQRQDSDIHGHALGRFLLRLAFSLELFQRLLMCPPTGSFLKNYPAATGYKSSFPLIRL